MPDIAHDPVQAAAAQFVNARLAARPLHTYPGAEPASMAAAYAVQDAAIRLWPDELAGWKVGLIQAPHRRRFGALRIAGPIFRQQIRRAGDAPTELPVITGGFAAVEAEFVIAVAAAPPAGKTAWTPEEADEYAGAMHIGVELAGSPFAEINDHGPAVTASDFGNNAGLVLGGEIASWREAPLEGLTAEMRIDGANVGRGSAASIPGGPLAAFAFILGNCAERGIAVRRGDLISTGAVTGVHTIAAAQEAEADFGALGVIRCRTAPARSTQP